MGNEVRTVAGIPTTANFAMIGGASPSSPIIINAALSSIYYLAAGDVVTPIGSGGVTSVAETFTGGLISVAGSPITTSGTLALTVAGTSGGIVYFSSGTTWASSGALTASRIVLGGGAGNAPTVLGSLGTTTTLLHGNAAGAPTFSAVVEADLGLTDITTANVSTSAHGFAPKAPNDATKYLDGTGAYTVPSGGGFTAATQAQMEAATSNTVGVTPLSANWHPGACKAWCKADTAGNMSASWNMTSVTDVGAGQITFNIATDFSSANWAASGFVLDSGIAKLAFFAISQTAGALGCQLGAGLTDPAEGYFFAGFGDQ